MPPPDDDDALATDPGDAANASPTRPMSEAEVAAALKAAADREVDRWREEWPDPLPDAATERR